MQIRIVSGNPVVTLTKREQKQLAEAAALCESLAKYAQCSAADDGAEALAALRDKYAIAHTPSQT